MSTSSYRGASRPPRKQKPSAHHGRGGRRTRRDAPRQPVRWGMLIVALAVLSAVAAVAWRVSTEPARPVAVAPPAISPDAAAAAAKADEKPSERAAPGRDKDRFAFYELLPKQSVLSQDTEAPRPLPRPVQRPKADGKEAKTASQKLWLDAGAYASAADAELVRRTIRGMGIPVRVLSETHADVTSHRVVAGPFASEWQRDTSRDGIAEAGLESHAVKTPEGIAP